MDNIIMIVIYWLLTAFWFFVTLSCTEKIFFGSSEFPSKKQFRPLATLFIILSLIFLIDSIYWALTNTSRVGVITKQIHTNLYKGWAVASIKSLFLLAAIIFWFLAIKTLRKLDAYTNEYFLASLIDQTWDAIGILDSEGKVLNWNRGAEKLYGFKQNEIKGKHIKEFLVPQERHKEIEEKLLKVKKELLPVTSYQTQRLGKDGRRIAVDITISPMLDEHNIFKGFFGIMREIPCPIIKQGINEPYDQNQCLLFQENKNIIPFIFIGHGRDNQWQDLKNHLQDKHGFNIRAYEIGEKTGLTITEALEEMLVGSNYAILVMTGEDTHTDGTIHARENVIHEIGLFQGRLGHKRVIILLEEGVKEFSNIHGINQIRFDKGHIKETFGDILSIIGRIQSERKRGVSSNGLVPSFIALNTSGILC